MESAGALRTFNEEGMLQPFTSCSACSIFNVSQLTAAHTGSLVKNATHASTPGCQAHASVVPLRTGPANTLGGGSLTLPLTDCVSGETRVVSVFHWQAARPLEPAGLFGHPVYPADLGQVSGANEAQFQGGGLLQRPQAARTVVDQRDRHSGSSTVGPSTDLGG